MPEPIFTDEQLGTRIMLGPHQHVIEATDEEGRSGKWIIHRPTMREEIKIGVEYALVKTPAGGLGPVEIDQERDAVAFAVATLNNVVDQRPAWFPKDAGESMDASLLLDLLSEFSTWRDSFRRRVSAAEGDSGGTPAAP